MMKSILLLPTLALSFLINDLSPQVSTLQARSWDEDILVVDKALTPHVNDFLFEKSQRLPATYGWKVASVTFGETDIDEVGVCEFYPMRIWLFEYRITRPPEAIQNLYSLDYEHREVRINKKAWKIGTEQMRRMTIFHEMAHCHLNLDHINEMNMDFKPRSIMYPVIISDLMKMTKEDEEFYIGTAFNIYGPHIYYPGVKSGTYKH